MQNNPIRTSIKEIFKSVQGEGPYVGYEQIFIRFCKCNLNCKYCDTDYKTDCTSYSSIELLDKINKLNPANSHSISLTGGEPLLDSDFLNKFLPLTNNKIYLETNGTLPEKLIEVIDLIDIISMDIKINSTSQMGDLFDSHNDFLETCIKYNKETFAKVIFNSQITDYEIEKCVDITKDKNVSIILQPQMNGDKLVPNTKETTIVFEKFIKKYKNIRLIPQVHKFLQVE